MTLPSFSRVRGLAALVLPLCLALGAAAPAAAQSITPAPGSDGTNPLAWSTTIGVEYGRASNDNIPGGGDSIAGAYLEFRHAEWPDWLLQVGGRTLLLPFGENTDASAYASSHRGAALIKLWHDKPGMALTGRIGFGKTGRSAGLLRRDPSDVMEVPLGLGIRATLGPVELGLEGTLYTRTKMRTLTGSLGWRF